MRGLNSLDEAEPVIELEASYDYVKILDFGVAKILAADLTRQTMSGVVIGTPQYMAPETARATKAVDHRIDIYALGVMFFEMLTGRLPFDATTPMEMMLAHCTAPVPRLRERNPDVEVTAAAEALILRAMAKDADERPQHMEEFLAELQHCYGDENFLRNWERQNAAAPPAPRSPRTPSLTEELKELFAGSGGSGNELLERLFADETKK